MSSCGTFLLLSLVNTWFCAMCYVIVFILSLAFYLFTFFLAGKNFDINHNFLLILKPICFFLLYLYKICIYLDV